MSDVQICEWLQNKLLLEDLCMTNLSTSTRLLESSCYFAFIPQDGLCVWGRGRGRGGRICSVCSICSVADSTKSFSFLSSSQKRWMLPRHTLDPCYAQYGLVIDTSQTGHYMTQSVYGQHQDVSGHHQAHL
jgi:hypothetical protein